MVIHQLACGFAKLLLLLISICCQADTISKQTKYFVALEASREVTYSSPKDLVNAQKKRKPGSNVTHSLPKDSANAQQKTKPSNNATIPLLEDFAEDAAYALGPYTSAPAPPSGIEKKLVALLDDVHLLCDDVRQVYAMMCVSYAMMCVNERDDVVPGLRYSILPWEKLETLTLNLH